LRGTCRTRMSVCVCLSQVDDVLLKRINVG